MRRNKRVRISQRTTFAHWLIRIGQIAIALDPLCIGCADDGFGCRADDEGFFEFARGLQTAAWFGFEAMMGDDSAFLGESFDMFGFLFKETDRNEQREIGIDVAGRLESEIQLAVECFPILRIPTAG